MHGADILLFSLLFSVLQSHTQAQVFVHSWSYRGEGMEEMGEREQREKREEYCQLEELSTLAGET